MKEKSLAVQEVEEQERLLLVNAISTLRRALRCADNGGAVVQGRLCGPCATHRCSQELEDKLLEATTLDEVREIMRTHVVDIVTLSVFAVCANGFSPRRGQESCNCPACTARRIVRM